MTSTTPGAVTLFNASYEPLGNISFKHAVKMLFRNVAVVHEADETRDTSIGGQHAWPKSVRLVRYIATKWMYRPAAYSKSGVLNRDHNKCAYCGGHATTVDHIHPASRGGKWEYINTVAACRTCNGRKADRTPDEAGMKLRFQPYVPTRAEMAALVAK